MVDIFSILVAVVLVAATAYWGFLRGSSKTEHTTESTEAASAPQPSKTPQSTKKKQQTHKKARKTAIPSFNTKRSKVPSHPRYIRRFGGHSDNVLTMSICPNGEWMATAGMDGLVRVAQTKKGSTLFFQTKVTAEGLGIFQDAQHHDTQESLIQMT